ncbi:hemolysin family protein [uncultured Paludibaculum sp.]|uniref:hemolysin family protein n=1 Tax=uncultured Paludibaculum sp. TaxID=1765020 RepID=UPI002AAB87AA|nr:hemolysin family protein [uncultured Paludibaculum sp.]
MIFLVAFILSCLLCLVSFVQVLYLESLRLRTREFESLGYFKETLQDKLGYETEQGAFVFSLIKHSLLVLSGSVFVAAAATRGEGWKGLLEGFILGWLVMMVASYLIPQALYRRSSGHWALPLVPLLHFLALLFKPLTAFLGFLQSLFELAESDSHEDKQDPSEEIEALITAGEEEGIIEKEDSRLIQNVVAFGDKKVREVMTPRREIVGIDVGETLTALRKLLKEQQFSRIPVYEGDIDHMVGFIHARDLYELDDEQRKTRTLRELARPILPVPEMKPVPKLLREMQERGIHIVYVVDEYGRVAGLATMEDLVEEVFGEIRDEHEPQHDVEKGTDGSITVSGSFDVDHLHEYFGYRPGEDIQSTTVGGLASEWYGAVPSVGTIVEQDGLIFEILAADDFRVDRVRIRASEPAADPEVETA